MFKDTRNAKREAVLLRVDSVVGQHKLLWMGDQDPVNSLRTHSVCVNSCSQSQICWGVIWHTMAVSKVH